MLNESGSDEWDSDSDETLSSESSDEDVEQLKGRAFWVKRAVTDDTKKKKEEKRSAKVGVDCTYIWCNAPHVNVSVSVPCTIICSECHFQCTT